MRVLVMGATGFIGRALIPRLQCDRHAVVARVRSPARAQGPLGCRGRTGSRRHGARRVGRGDRSLGCRRADSAGEPLMGGRWTAARPRRPRRQPHRGHRAAGAGHGRGEDPPARLHVRQRRRLYGDQADELLTEASSGGDDFFTPGVPAVGERGRGRSPAGRARRVAANRRRAGPVPTWTSKRLRCAATSPCRWRGRPR